ncbi:MAG: TIGR00730 family Rossman fold protein [Candidatus Zixiibacteriota bacterium]
MSAKEKKKDTTEWPIKAYKNIDFLNSPAARTIRVMTEMVEPADRFRRNNLWNTVVFFGSARTIPEKEAKGKLFEIESRIRKAGKVTPGLKAEYEGAKKGLIMSAYYEEAAQLSEMLTKWFKEVEQKNGKSFSICTGGGPGIMEAANRGAKKAGGRSVGLNISLPMEQYPNKYQTRELSFEFHYFFIRKFWFFYLAKALVVFPGGFGTLDEFFELLTIIQTGKSKKTMPVVLFGSGYWKEVLNFEKMVYWGTISPEDLKLFRIFDDVDKTFEYLKNELTRHYLTTTSKNRKG